MNIDTPIRFEDTPSFTPWSPVRTSERLDPYYDALWSDGTQASWLSKARARRSERAGVGKLPPHLKTHAAEAWARFDRGIGWDQKLSVLAAVDSWRTMTSEQLAAITGHHKLATGRTRTTGDLFATDLIEVGVFADAMRSGPRAARATLFRPARQSPSTERMEQSLTYPEWVSVTGGSGYEFTRQFDRHNLLATELGLRAAEFCRVGTVLGEKLSLVNTLAYEGWGAVPPLSGSQQTADLTIVRRDGLRIAVEITASQGNALDTKINKWANTLNRRRTANSGLVVVFIVAGRADSSIHTTAQVLTKTRAAIKHAARQFPGPAHDRTADRMMVAEWSDWFPSRGMTTPGFLNLTAERATGPAENPWENVSMLDPNDLPYTPSGDTHLAVLDNTSGMRSVPHWLRTGTPPELWEVSLERQGFATIPRLTGPTDKGRIRREFASATGAVGAAGPADRLLFRSAA